MTELKTWLHAHPIKAVLFSLFFTHLGGVCSMRDDLPLKLGLPLWLLGTIIWRINWRRDKITAEGKGESI